jgi:tetratricopeptide (TPR) repeat protein
MRTEQWPAAEAFYQTTLEMAGTHPIVVELHYELAQVYAFSKEALPRAIQHLDFILAVDPYNHAAHAFKGNLQEDLGQETAAIRSWTKATRIRKTYCPALNNLGRVSMNKGDLDEARTLFSRCLKAEPDFPAALLNRGALRVAEGDCEGAREDLGELAESEDALGVKAKEFIQACE